MKKYIDLSKYDSKLTIEELINLLGYEEKKESKESEEFENKIKQSFLGKYFKFKEKDYDDYTCYIRIKNIEFEKDSSFKVWINLQGERILIRNNSLYILYFEESFTEEELNNMIEISKEEYQLVTQKIKSIQEDIRQLML